MIDPDLCISDQECLNFCRNDVFALDEATGKVIVGNPFNCVVGCDSCAQICPVQAITFPDKEQLRETLRRLRTEAAGETASVPK
jgi:NAD-dependent dihydropyrimidine dehydrogenase PreA subunit